MTSTLTYFLGEPNYDWLELLNQVLINGTYSNITSSEADLTQVDGGTTITLVLNGASLSGTTGGNQLDSGSIVEASLFVDTGGGPQEVYDFAHGVVTVDFSKINTLITTVGTDLPGAHDPAFAADLAPVFEGESVNATGSNDQDTIYGSNEGGDSIAANGGDDTIIMNADSTGSNGVSNIDGGDGFDFLGFDPDIYPNGVTIDFGAGTVSDNVNGQVTADISNIEGAGGTAGNDHFISSSDDGGSFYWAASLGNNQYDGPGDNNFKRLSYADLQGDSGGVADGHIVVDFAAQTVEKFNSLNVVVGTDHFWGVNSVVGTAYADTFTGDVWNNEFEGLAGNDTFFGGGGDDRVSYDNDDGNGGHFGVVVNFSDQDIVVNAMTVAKGTGLDGFGDTDTYIDIDQAKGTQYADYMVGGDGQTNHFEGNDGNDTLVGGDAHDELFGGAGGDLIQGNDGDDYIAGSSGQDTVDGGTGDDALDYLVNYDDGRDHSGDSIAVIYDGAGSSGTVTGSFNDNDVDPTVNAVFTNIDDLSGTAFNDSFTVDANVTTDGDVNYRTFNDSRDPGGPIMLVGNAGADTFTDLGSGAALINYNNEYHNHNDGNHTAVAINLSASDQVADVGRGDETIAAGGHALDTYGDTDTISGVVAYNLVDDTGANDFFWGDDTGGAAGVYVQAGGGDDFLVGGSGNDELHGDQGNDIIDGGAGNDSLQGADDNDSIVGGIGNDNISGDNGLDTLSGDDGNDSISGGSDNDSISGDAGRDVLNGDDGNDAVSGGDGSDRISGGNDADVLHGDAGADQVNGDDGDDHAYGDDGNDSVGGGSGDDHLYGDAGNDQLDGDDGNDTIFGDDRDGDGTAAQLQNGVLVTGGGDQLNGEAGNDTIYGGYGNDSINGDDNNDLLYGGAGNDRIDGGNDDDVLHGGAGNDAVSGDDGNDTITGDHGVDNLDGGSGNNSITGGSDAGATQLNGDDGNDTLVAGADGARYYGGAGNDTYDLKGFAVGDLFDGDNNGNNSGTDTVLTTITRNLNQFGNIENLTLQGSSNINGTGNSFNNTITGNAGNNSLLGGDGNDSLLGGVGNDTLNGQNNNDTLNGQAGNDTMTGGGGNDTFVFNTALSASTNLDKITDFTHSTDKIDLENAIFTGLSTGTLASGAFQSGTTHTATGSHHIVYDKSDGTLWYDSDGSGSHAAVEFAVLTTHPTNITNADFTVV